MKKLIVGNWKMHGSLGATEALCRNLYNDLKRQPRLTQICEFVICPPFVHLSTAVMDTSGAPVSIGAQDCSAFTEGAYTGDISAAMLRDLGCTHVILGHSERRIYHNETDETVARKAVRTHEAGLTAIICVGENEQERQQGRHREVVERQLAGSLPEGANTENTVIAYEPVWAIGTGNTATPEDAEAMHAFIREKTGDIRILYGGSMKPDNAGALLAMPHIDGGLIGGASLKSDQFMAIAKAAQKD